MTDVIDPRAPGEARRNAGALEKQIDAILDQNHVMSLATNRPDGWPQVTQVNYLHDGRDLYFVVARDSQKLANIQRDNRVSIALGGTAARSRCRGLSMSAHVIEVSDLGEVAHLNQLLWRSPDQNGFKPHPESANIAVLKARPHVVSLIDYSSPPGFSEIIDMTAVGG